MELSKFFKKAPLVPIICQDERNGEVLMLGYANEEALQLTIDTGTAWFFSRSRQKLWNKGETSGNFIFVSRILSDSRMTTSSMSALRSGLPHRTPHLLFHHAAGEAGRKVKGEQYCNRLAGRKPLSRRAEPQEGSYTCYLFEKGIDKILKKVGEECAETIIAAKNGDKAELVGEINDVFYHMMVMMNECGVTMEDVCKEMDIRAQKIGNLKKFHFGFLFPNRCYFALIQR